MSAATYTPFPIGTVRGPYTYGNPSRPSCQFLVQGVGGWIPFCGNRSEESELEKRAKNYARKVLRNAKEARK